MQIVPLHRPQPDPALIADLRELLSMAEAGDVDYIAYVATGPNETITCEAGSRDPYRVHGLLHELAAEVLEDDDCE
jgi:hypothetical protein